jgi:hypothetical protein
MSSATPESAIANLKAESYECSWLATENTAELLEGNLVLVQPQRKDRP